jgi:SAM-dependent methyltransferase
MALWLLLAATASAMLMATTNQLCQEVAAVPFLWVLPLAVYLLSFIICFDSERWYDRRVWGTVLLVSVPAGVYVLAGGIHTSMAVQLGLLTLTLFACCMSCHGELAKAKPAPRYLTRYYLLMALGGALGGGFVALAAPAWFLDYWEYHVALAGCCILTAAAWYRRADWRSLPVKPGPLWLGLGGLLFLLVVALVTQAVTAQGNAIAARRNFFGVLRIAQGAFPGDDGTPHPARMMIHGRVNHGFQFLEPERRHWPTAYFGPGTGIDMALKHHPRRTPKAGGRGALRVGVVGLGTGTMVALGEPGDHFRLYEINPDVVDLAREHFTYLADTASTWEVVLGDARLELERELKDGQVRGFDVLALDAFISDAVPVHLLTVEFVETCLRHLRPDGLLVFNISNRFVDLAPLMAGLADHFGLHLLFFARPRDFERGLTASKWAVLAPDRTFGNCPKVRPHLVGQPGTGRPPMVWTDDFASLWRAVVW